MWILLNIGKSFIAGVSSPGLPIDESVLTALDSFSVLVLIGIGIVLIFLIIFYVSKLSGEKSKDKKALENRVACFILSASGWMRRTYH